MNWKTITVAATPGSIDRLETLLWDAGAVSVTVQDGGDEPLLEPGPQETPLWQEAVVTGLFEEDIDTREVVAHLQAARFPVLQEEQVADRVWEREWLSRFKPTRFGRRLWVCPTELEAPPEAETVMYLDPGLAFGTGTHPTTRLCLEWLDAHIQPGMRVIDYGCGSGILGIAALLLGAVEVVAVDNDPQALTATQANALSNHVADRLRTFLPGDAPRLSADLVIANILAQPLIELAPLLQQLAGEGGRLVLSGIMQSQIDWVIKAYESVRFEAPCILDDWVCLSGTVA